MDGLTSITLTIAIIGCLIGVCTFFFDRNNDSKKDEHSITTVSTKLDFISEDVKDIKADQRVFQRDINEVRSIAINAEKRADAAHRRLDIIAAEKTIQNEEE